MKSKSHSLQRPWQVAHRGARDEAPENTRSAFERALLYPIDGIELDVQMTADSVPVIFHDRTLYRIACRRLRVSDLSYDELKQMDWGRWFHPDFAGEPILTMEQTLSLFGRRTRLLIEIKSRPYDQSCGHSNKLTQNLLQILADEKYHLSTERICILSFDPRVLLLAYDLAPGWRYVLNLLEAEANTIMEALPHETSHLWAVCVKISKLSQPLVQWAKERDLRVFTYTCNGPNQVRKALRLGVDAIISDRPGWLTRFTGSGVQGSEVQGSWSPARRGSII